MKWISIINWARKMSIGYKNWKWVDTKWILGIRPHTQRNTRDYLRSTSVNTASSTWKRPPFLVDTRYIHYYTCSLTLCSEWRRILFRQDYNGKSFSWFANPYHCWMETSIAFSNVTLKFDEDYIVIKVS